MYKLLQVWGWLTFLTNIEKYLSGICLGSSVTAFSMIVGD